MNSRTYTQINIDTWVNGYKVRAFDWIDGKNIYINVAYYRPGSSIEKPPAREKSVLIPKEEARKLEQHLDSIVVWIMESSNRIIEKMED